MSGGPDSIEKWIERHLEDRRGTGTSQRTVESARFILRKFAAFVERRGTGTAAGLRRRNLEDWRNSLLAKTKRDGLPLSPKTINQRLIQTRNLLKFMAAGGRIPPRLIETLPLLKEPKTLPGSTPTHAEARRTLAKIAGSTPVDLRDRAVFELLYGSGLRAGELIGLTLADVDFKSRTLRVMGKGRKERLVPIGGNSLRALDSYVRAARPFMAGADEKALFIDAKRKPMSYASLRRLVVKRRPTTKNGEVLTAHSFRRACATEMIKSGAGLHHVKDILGHERLDTLQRYVKLTVEDLKKAHAKHHPREKDAR